MAIQMTRAEYEAKYGASPSAPTSASQNAPIQMTRQQYEQQYGSLPSSQKAPQAPAQPEKKSLGGFIDNLGSSALDFGRSIATAVTHPVQTLKTLGSLSLGALDNLNDFQTKAVSNLPIGGAGQQAVSKALSFVNPLTAIPQRLRSLGVNLDSSNQLADQLGQTYKERYGGLSNIGETAYTDPVGVLADLATLLSGGAGVVGKIGEVSNIGSKAGTAGRLSNIASTLSKSANAIDPLQAIIRAGSRISGRFFNAPKPTIANLIEQIIQPNKKTISGYQNQVKSAENAFRNIDFSGVKTYNDLFTKLKEASSKMLKSIDDYLGSRGGYMSSDDFTISTKVGNTTIRQNFVVDALDQLEELYSVTRDAVKQAEIVELKNQLNTKGLSPLEVNYLAREYGTEFGSKAFSKNGDALTSVNAQTVENTRKGLKDTVNSKMPDNFLKDTDKKISELIATQKLVEKMATKVSALKSRTTPRTFIQNVANYSAKGADLISGGFLSSFLNSFLKSNVGLKSLNSIDLQNALRKNLKLIDNELNNVPVQSFIDRNSSRISNTIDRLPGSDILKYIVGQMYNTGKATRSSTLFDRATQDEEEDKY